MTGRSRRNFIRSSTAALASFAVVGPYRIDLPEELVRPDDSVEPNDITSTGPVAPAAVPPDNYLVAARAAVSADDNPQAIWEYRPWDVTADQPSPGVWRTIVGGAGFFHEDDSQWDSVFYQGYNVADGATLENLDEPGAWWAIEANYLNPSGSRWIEAYYEIRYGHEQGEQLRPIFFIFNRDDNVMENIIFQTESGISFNDYADRSWGNLKPERIAIVGRSEQEQATELAIASQNGRGAQLSISSDLHDTSFVLTPSGGGNWSWVVDGQTPMRLATDSVVFGDPSGFDGAVTSRVAPERLDAHANYTAEVREGQSTSAFQVKYGRGVWGTQIKGDGRILAAVGSPDEHALVDGDGRSEVPVFGALEDEGTGMSFPGHGELSLYAAGTRVARLSAERPVVTSTASVQDLVDALVALDLIVRDEPGALVDGSEEEQVG